MARYIRFDWAIKRLLRQKANFVVLEGLISTLLNKKIKIDTLLESESNQESWDDKQNRVDILAQDDRGAKYIIEVQNTNETSYFQRILYGTSKLITEYIKKGDNYHMVAKVYSINIVYFDLGLGEDYVYYGKTEFRGMHKNDVLNLSPLQLKTLDASAISDLFPEYYILKINGFNDVAVTPLEEWIDFLKNERIPEHPKAPGLEEAKTIMEYEAMSVAERRDYDSHINNAVILQDNFDTAKMEGMMEGEKIGMEKGEKIGMEKGEKIGMEKGEKIGMEKGEKIGMEKGEKIGMEKGKAEGAMLKNIENARRMRLKGLSVSDIAEITGLSASEIEGL